MPANFTHTHVDQSFLAKQRKPVSNVAWNETNACAVGQLKPKKRRRHNQFASTIVSTDQDALGPVKARKALLTPVDMPVPGYPVRQQGAQPHRTSMQKYLLLTFAIIKPILVLLCAPSAFALKSSACGRDTRLQDLVGNSPALPRIS